MSLAEDQVYLYQLDIGGGNPRIGYRTTTGVEAGQTVEYRHPVTGIISIHTVSDIAFEEPTSTRTGPVAYKNYVMPYDFPPKNLDAWDISMIPVNANWYQVVEEDGFDSAHKLAIINAT